MNGLRLAFLNRRFRWLLLAMAGIPIGLLYLVRGLQQPLMAAGGGGNDLFDGYLPAALLIGSGGDPYTAACRGHSCFPLLSASSSFQPPAMLWALTPLAALPARTADIVAILAVNLSVLVFLLAMLRALEVRDRQLTTLCALLVIGWTPTLLGLLERQPQMLLLALSGLWLLGYAARRRDLPAGAALGIATALKLQTAPVALLPLLRRRWGMVAGIALGAISITALGAPRLLPEYVLQVVPQISVGTGHAHNVSFAGAVERVLDSPSLYGGVPGASPLVRPIALAFGLAVLLLTLFFMSRHADGREWRLRDACAIAAVTPLLSTLTFPIHLVAELVPILILVVTGIRESRVGLVVFALAGWVLIGLVNQAFLAMTADPQAFAPWLLHVMSESALAGQLAIWAGALLALRSLGPVLAPGLRDPQELASHLRVVGVNAAPEGRSGR